jgi:hypothetical protein
MLRFERNDGQSLPMLKTGFVYALRNDFVAFVTLRSRYAAYKTTFKVIKVWEFFFTQMRLYGMP